VNGSLRIGLVLMALLPQAVLARALITAKRTGVVVESLADREMMVKPDGGSQIPSLAAAVPLAETLSTTH
jgi:hypothetical protein